MAVSTNVTTFAAPDYNLTATLESGQAFRWSRLGESWEGVIDERWVRLKESDGQLTAETALPCREWGWLSQYLQLEVDFGSILSTFPPDRPMSEAVDYCRGLRLLRQEPWECLVSFILSSTKQIVQIRQIVRLLCERHGNPIPALVPGGLDHSFPKPTALASLSETELRACKMGFRAPYLLETAQCVAKGELDLADLGRQPLDEARTALMRLPGVGRKVADCVLLFAYGFPTAFPVDVWVLRALQRLYFRGRRVSLKRLQRFSQEHFGPCAGYAQQYLFHYVRTGQPSRTDRPPIGGKSKVANLDRKSKE